MKHYPIRDEVYRAWNEYLDTRLKYLEVTKHARGRLQVRGGDLFPLKLKQLRERIRTGRPFTVRCKLESGVFTIKADDLMFIIHLKKNKLLTVVDKIPKRGRQLSTNEIRRWTKRAHDLSLDADERLEHLRSNKRPYRRERFIYQAA